MHIVAGTILEDIRYQFIKRLSIYAMCLSGVGMWLTLPVEPYPYHLLAVGAWMFITSHAAFKLVDSRPNLARFMFMASLNSTMLVLLILNDSSWLLFATLPLAVLNGFLLPFGEVWYLGSAFLFAVLSQRAYPLLELGVFYGISGLLITLMLRTLHTALQWYGFMQHESTRLLEEARDHRAELQTTLRSLRTAINIQNRLRHDLIWAREQAESARRLKEQFTANITHELRTPLNIILGFSEMMYLSPEIYADVNWSATLRRDVYQIYRSSRHLLDMIDDILNLTHFEMTKFTVNLEATPFETFMRDTVDIAAALFRGSPVELMTDIQGPLPEIQIDRTRIRQVVLNLLSNARYFTESGWVHLQVWAQDDDIAVKVTDTGRGIPADKLPYVFDEFYQVDYSLSRKHGGAGLGLAISKHFIEAHQGRIAVNSQVGVGSSFCFRLPVHPPYRALPTPRNLPRTIDPTHPNILVIETDEEVVNMIGRCIPAYEIIQHDPACADSIPEVMTRLRPKVIIHNIRPDDPPDSAHIPGCNVPYIRSAIPGKSWLASEFGVIDCLARPVSIGSLSGAINRCGHVQEIVIMDDDRGFIQLAERMLRAINPAYCIRHVYDVQEGMAALADRKPDLVLLDLGLCEASGFQLLRRLRTEHDVTVILLTTAEFNDDLMLRDGGQLSIQYPKGSHFATLMNGLRTMVDTLK